MIVVKAECRILQDQWQNFEECMNILSPIVREEAGCLRYDILTSVEEPGLFIILEEWETRKHLDEHLATPHMREHMKITSPWSSDPIALTLYEVSDVERQKI